MRQGLLALTAIWVVLAGCLGGSEVPAAHCGDAPGSTCSEAADAIVPERGAAVGSGTYRLASGSPFIFDVPPGMLVDVSELSRRDLTIHPHPDGGPLPSSVLGPRIPAHVATWTEIEDLATRSVLTVDPRTGEELGRVSRNPETGTTIAPVVTSGWTRRAILDGPMGHVATTYPTDYVSLVPDVDALVARVPVDGLFDAIVASIRVAR